MVAQNLVRFGVQLLARRDPLRLGVQRIPEDLHTLVFAGQLSDCLLELGNLFL